MIRQYKVEATLTAATAAAMSPLVEDAGEFKPWPGGPLRRGRRFRADDALAAYAELKGWIVPDEPPAGGAKPAPKGRAKRAAAK